MFKPGKHSIGRAFYCAIVGLIEFTRGRNSRIQIVCAFATVALAALLKLSAPEWIAIVLAIAMVLSLEALNTAVEQVVDLASPGEHELARRAKDVAAGAVLIASIAAAIVGALVFAPHVIALWRTSGSP